MKDQDPHEANEQRLLLRFDRERDNPAVATELVTRLLVRMRAYLRRRWPRKAYYWDEIERAALLRLVEWRHEGRLRAGEDSLESLAERLVDAEARREQTHQGQKARLLEKIDADPELLSEEPPDNERREESRELLRKTLDLIDRLPAEQSVILQALVDEYREDGPRMEDAVGITRREAQARLRQARVALLNLAIEENLAEDLTAFLEGEG